MALLDFERRWSENVTGRFYVSNHCLDCDLCRTLAPRVFGRNDQKGYSFVKKQPEPGDEMEATLEALRGCCTETIHSDGNHFDWNLIQPKPELDYPNE